VLVSDFDFDLPEELIAQEPPKERGDSRMLLLDRRTGAWRDEVFRHFPEQLRAGDVLVLNDSRVIPARLFGTRTRRADEAEPAPGRIEVLLTEQLDAWEWNALVKPGRKLRVGDGIEFASGAVGTNLHAEVIATGERGERTLRFSPVADFERRLDALGHMPLPPYIHRADRPLDRERYQTVYAARRGSAAAPTAGLHFTPELFARLAEAGVATEFVTLHVGAGTFLPVKTEVLAEHRMHSEWGEVDHATAERLNAAREAGGRIVCVGTTSLRLLESATGEDGVIRAFEGETAIFITPGYRFRAAEGLMTNFHLPKSTLFMLVSAFAGLATMRRAYQHAITAGYRFYSYGDASLLWKAA
jgi:S-adenosylmethionine:tRNA ribosyltransferase-isomerase